MRQNRSIARLVWMLPLTFVCGMVAAWALAWIAGVQPSALPLVSAILGLVVAFAVPVWQAFFLNAPKLTIEISSIRRAISASATLSIKDDPELKALLPKRPSYMPYIYLGDDADGPYNQSSKRSDIEQLDARLASAKQRLKDLPAQIEERKRDLERAQSLLATNLNRHDVAVLNRPLGPEVEFDVNDPQGVIDALTKTYQDRLDETEKDQVALQAAFPVAERRIELAKQDLLANRSLFTVSVSLINSGRSNTAIKAPGLLRVSIGQGNYIDIKLAVYPLDPPSTFCHKGA